MAPDIIAAAENATAETEEAVAAAQVAATAAEEAVSAAATAEAIAQAAANEQVVETLEEHEEVEGWQSAAIEAHAAALQALREEMNRQALLIVNLASMLEQLTLTTASQNQEVLPENPEVGTVEPTEPAAIVSSENTPEEPKEPPVERKKRFRLL